MRDAVVFLHIAGVATFVGATVMLALLLRKVDRGAGDAVARRRSLASVFQVYNPLAIAALGVVVMSGAASVTRFKQALGPSYFSVMGAYLAGKLVLAFILIMLTTWIAFGMCHPLVRRDQGALPVTDAELDRLLARLRPASWLTVAVAGWTLWKALRMSLPPLG
ncbi:MAG: hypothetical protein ACE5E4_01590 [Candidatus Binatia bacterium]